MTAHTQTMQKISEKFSDAEWAVLNRRGEVVATIEWMHGLREYIYTLDDRVLQEIPRLQGDVSVEEWANELHAQGRLIRYEYIVAAHASVLRVDDRPEGRSYRLYPSSSGASALKATKATRETLPEMLVSRVIAGVEEEDTEPKSLGEVRKLAADPATIWVSELPLFNGEARLLSDPEVAEKLSLPPNGVVVWNEAAIQRQADARYRRKRSG